MKVIRVNGFEFRYRWPWKVKEHDAGGFTATAPKWAAPIRWMARLCGIKLVEIRKAKVGEA